MLLRIATGVVLIPVVVAIVWWGPPWLMAVAAAAVALLALAEFFNLGDRVGLHAFRIWTMLCAAGIFFAQYSQGMIETHRLADGVSLVRDVGSRGISIEAVLLIFLFGAAASGLGTRRPLHEVLPDLSLSAAGMLFVALPFSYVVRINEIGQTGSKLLLFTLCLIWVGDTTAYFVGRSVGRLRMAPVLSPKKTWEGAVANAVGSLIVAALFAPWMHTDVVELLLIALVANIAGQVGDLMKSSYKRGAGVKDSGNLLPGHGGMLDRIDSLIFASPVVWLAWQWLASR